MEVWSIGSGNRKCPKVSEIIGSSNESTILVNNIETEALLDTGSCVSTCSKSFYENYLNSIELMPLDNFVASECANGGIIPYFGYIQVDIQTLGIPTDHVQNCMLLIVPETEFNSKLPILLGTNVLGEF